MASRNRTQTCESPSHGKRDADDDGGLVGVRSEITLLVTLLVTTLIRPFSGAGRCWYQHMTVEQRVEVTEDTLERGRAGEVKLPLVVELV